MKLLFDNCTSPVLASTLDGFIRSEGHSAFHIKDLIALPNGRHAADLQWIDYLRRQDEQWAFITGDKRVMKNRPERAALRSAGLHGFVLAPGYQSTELHQQAAALLWKWPEIEAVTKLFAPPAMYEIPINRNSKLRSLPL